MAEATLATAIDPVVEKSAVTTSSKQQIIFAQSPINSRVTTIETTSPLPFKLMEEFETSNKNLSVSSLESSNVKLLFTQASGSSMQPMTVGNIQIEQLDINQENVHVINKCLTSSCGSLNKKKVSSGISTKILIPSSCQNQPISAHSVLLSGNPTKMITIAKSNPTTTSTRLLPSPQKNSPKQMVDVLSPSKNAVNVVSVSRSPQKIAPATTLGSKSKCIGVHDSAASQTTSVVLSRHPVVQHSPTKVMIKPVVLTTLKSATQTTASPTQIRFVASNSSSQTSIRAKQATSTASAPSFQLTSNRYPCLRLVATPVSQNLTVRSFTPSTQSTSSIRSTMTLLPQNQKISLQRSNGHSGLNQIAPKPLLASQQLLFPASAVTKLAQLQPINLTSATVQGQSNGNTLLTGGNSISRYVMIPTNSQYQVQQNGQLLSGSQQTARMILPSGQVPTLLPATNIVGSSALSGCQQTFIPVSCTPTTKINYNAVPPQSTLPPPTSGWNQQQTAGSGGQTGEERFRKPCNCSKSQCLKLYCDCFANGEFCKSCNCNNCYNNLDHEEERQKAIKICLERNPFAFHPKIGKYKDGIAQRRHTKGCNCKRSGCLKNYCECYEAKIMCTHLCKCVGCKNIEDNCEKKTLMHLADAVEVRVQQQAAAKTKISFQLQDFPTRPANFSAEGHRLPCAFVTQEVVEATVQCLLAQGEDAEKSELVLSLVEQRVLEEFGKCLRKIIECSSKSTDLQT
ncbi:uncharacterized protein LOC143233959 [Tachypleus tridentatus]|uniref:uncharacterized protein LOC143233959 n=1 Tax=Tachypleus tridentatus TaxID=6853 RepID=UPI003FD202E0